MNFHGTATKVNDDDILACATHIGVPYAAFRAVIAVEAAGSGFDAAGRPKILFERHIFYRQLKNDPDKLDQAVASGLAYPKWGEKPYPKGSDAVYAELEAACEIDETAALMSTSWGMGQIMGSNYKLAGCASVQEMVEAAKESEANQLLQMGNFIKSAGLADELASLNWAGFARGYNGPGYAQNKYDEKLAANYEKFA
jgi:hypothetical protein